MAIGELTIFRPLRTIGNTLSRHRTAGFNHPDPEHTIKISKIGYTLMLALNATPLCLALRPSPGHASNSRLQTDALRPLG
jgi:hypothetical protein